LIFFKSSFVNIRFFVIVGPRDSDF
jgi:hypothetical protein